MKAHSSRVPGKNFRPISGKPLFQWMLDTLLELDFVSRVLINTDAAAELKAAGLQESDRVELKQRPQALCGDEVSMNLILEDDLASHPHDFYLMTHTTNPLLSAATLRGAWEKFQDSLGQGHDSMFSVNRHQTRFYREDASPINHDPNNLIPTQELEPWFEENSCFYFFSPASFAATGARIGEKPAMYETPKLESVDIDEPDDWNMAEALLTGPRAG